MRYIDADALLERMKRDPLFPLVEKYGVSGVIEAEPTADVQGVRHGKWQMKPLFNSQLDESDVAVRIRCSGCGMKLIAQKCGPFPNYCANCGARMERREDGETN